MKTLKKKMIWFAIMAAAGIVLFATSIVQGETSSTITGFASGLSIVSFVKLIQFYRISKNPQLLKKFGIEQKEERFISIAEKSGRFAFILTLVVEFFAIFVLILIKQNVMASAVIAVVGIQTFAYLITYFYLCKKY
jgi:hypothetical protein